MVVICCLFVYWVFFSSFLDCFGLVLTNISAGVTVFVTAVASVCVCVGVVVGVCVGRWVCACVHIYINL